MSFVFLTGEDHVEHEEDHSIKIVYQVCKTCIVCDFMTMSKKLLAQHSMGHMSGKHLCNYCNARMPSLTALRSHEDQHKRAGPTKLKILGVSKKPNVVFKCSLCYFNSRNAVEVGMHFLEKHRKYRCGSCLAYCPDQESYEQHLKGHSPVKTSKVVISRTGANQGPSHSDKDAQQDHSQDKALTQDRTQDEAHKQGVLRLDTYKANAVFKSHLYKAEISTDNEVRIEGFSAGLSETEEPAHSTVRDCKRILWNKHSSPFDSPNIGGKDQVVMPKSPNTKSLHIETPEYIIRSDSLSGPNEHNVISESDIINIEELHELSSLPLNSQRQDLPDVKNLHEFELKQCSVELKDLYNKHKSSEVSITKIQATAGATPQTAATANRKDVNTVIKEGFHKVKLSWSDKTEQNLQVISKVDHNLSQVAKDVFSYALQREIKDGSPQLSKILILQADGWKEFPVDGNEIRCAFLLGSDEKTLRHTGLLGSDERTSSKLRTVRLTWSDGNEQIVCITVDSSLTPYQVAQTAVQKLVRKELINSGTPPLIMVSVLEDSGFELFVLDGGKLRKKDDENKASDSPEKILHKVKLTWSDGEEVESSITVNSNLTLYAVAQSVLKISKRNKQKEHGRTLKSISIQQGSDDGIHSKEFLVDGNKVIRKGDENKAKEVRLTWSNGKEQVTFMMATPEQSSHDIAQAMLLQPTVCSHIDNGTPLRMISVNTGSSHSSSWMEFSINGMKVRGKTKETSSRLVNFTWFSGKEQMMWFTTGSDQNLYQVAENAVHHVTTKDEPPASPLKMVSILEDCGWLKFLVDEGYIVRRNGGCNLKEVKLVWSTGLEEAFFARVDFTQNLHQVAQAVLQSPRVVTRIKLGISLKRIYIKQSCHWRLWDEYLVDGRMVTKRDNDNFVLESAENKQIDWVNALVVDVRNTNPMKKKTKVGDGDPIKNKTKVGDGDPVKNKTKVEDGGIKFRTVKEALEHRKKQHPQQYMESEQVGKCKEAEASLACTTIPFDNSVNKHRLILPAGLFGSVVKDTRLQTQTSAATSPAAPPNVIMSQSGCLISHSKGTTPAMTLKPGIQTMGPSSVQSVNPVTLTVSPGIQAVSPAIHSIHPTTIQNTNSGVQTTGVPVQVINPTIQSADPPVQTKPLPIQNVHPVPQTTNPSIQSMNSQIQTALPRNQAANSAMQIVGPGPQPLTVVVKPLSQVTNTVADCINQGHLSSTVQTNIAAKPQCQITPNQNLNSGKQVSIIQNISSGIKTSAVLNANTGIQTSVLKPNAGIHTSTVRTTNPGNQTSSTVYVVIPSSVSMSAVNVQSSVVPSTVGAQSSVVCSTVGVRPSVVPSTIVQSSGVAQSGFHIVNLQRPVAALSAKTSSMASSRELVVSNSYAVATSAILQNSTVSHSLASVASSQAKQNPQTVAVSLGKNMPETVGIITSSAGRTIVSIVASETGVARMQKTVTSIANASVTRASVPHVIPSMSNATVRRVEATDAPKGVTLIMSPKGKSMSNTLGTSVLTEATRNVSLQSNPGSAPILKPMPTLKRKPEPVVSEGASDPKKPCLVSKSVPSLLTVKRPEVARTDPKSVRSALIKIVNEPGADGQAGKAQVLAMQPSPSEIGEGLGSIKITNVTGGAEETDGTNNDKPVSGIAHAPEKKDAALLSSKSVTQCTATQSITNQSTQPSQEHVVRVQVAGNKFTTKIVKVPISKLQNPSANITQVSASNIQKSPTRPIVMQTPDGVCQTVGYVNPVATTTGGGLKCPAMKPQQIGLVGSPHVNEPVMASIAETPNLNTVHDCIQKKITGIEKRQMELQEEIEERQIELYKRMLTEWEVTRSKKEIGRDLTASELETIVGHTSQVVCEKLDYESRSQKIAALSNLVKKELWKKEDSNIKKLFSSLQLQEKIATELTFKIHAQQLKEEIQTKNLAVENQNKKNFPTDSPQRATITPETQTGSTDNTDRQILPTEKPREPTRTHPTKPVVYDNTIKPLALHLGTQKDGSTMYSCDRCVYNTPALHKFEQHLEAHAHGKYVCKVCKKAMIKSSDLTKHWHCHKMISRNGERMCDSCPFTTNTKEELEDHMKRHYYIKHRERLEQMSDDDLKVYWGVHGYTYVPLKDYVPNIKPLARGKKRAHSSSCISPGSDSLNVQRPRGRPRKMSPPPLQKMPSSTHPNPERDRPPGLSTSATKPAPKALSAINSTTFLSAGKPQDYLECPICKCVLERSLLNKHMILYHPKLKKNVTPVKCKDCDSYFPDTAADRLNHKLTCQKKFEVYIETAEDTRVIGRGESYDDDEAERDDGGETKETQDMLGTSKDDSFTMEGVEIIGERTWEHMILDSDEEESNSGEPNTSTSWHKPQSSDPNASTTKEGNYGDAQSSLKGVDSSKETACREDSDEEDSEEEFME